MDDLMNNVNSLSHNRGNMDWIGLSAFEMQVPSIVISLVSAMVLHDVKSCVYWMHHVS
jgi:hypothetical protein